MNKKIFVLSLVFLVLLACTSFASDKLYVDNDNAEIKVNWSEEIVNPYAILEGEGLATGIANFNCSSTDSDFTCVRDQFDDSVYYYNSVSKLSDGNYTFTIFASDLNGNPMDEFIDKEFVVDTKSPLLENFSYTVSGITQTGKVVEFTLDFDDGEVLNGTPKLVIDEVELSAVPAVFVGNVYKFNYYAKNTDTQKYLSIKASDLAGNTFEDNKLVVLTAPKPPITNPFDGAVISPYTGSFSFFYFERIPVENMLIYYDGLEISNTANFVETSVDVLDDMLYYYHLPSGYVEGVSHTLTIEAWDDNNNKLGPYDISFTVDPDVPRNPDVYFDGFLGSFDSEGIIIDTNTPKIRIEFPESDIFINSLKIITSQYEFVNISLDSLTSVESSNSVYEFTPDFELPEGLNSVVIGACREVSGETHCFSGFTSSIIINVGAPEITYINPQNPNGGDANSQYMIIHTNEWAECKEINRREAEDVPPRYFFYDESDRENDRYYYFSNIYGYGGNGFVHDTLIKMNVNNPDSSAPVWFNYTVVCKDMFDEYTNLEYMSFRLDLTAPIIDSIEPSSSINYYFTLDVTTNEDTTCKYILINTTDDVTNFDSDEYEDFYDNQMNDMIDDDLTNQYRSRHLALIDNTIHRGNIKSDGVYDVYVDCEDAAGNFAKNKQFFRNSDDLIKEVKKKSVSVDTSEEIKFYNMSLDGVIKDQSSLLKFNTNRNVRCYFKFAGLEELEYFESTDPLLNSKTSSGVVGDTDGYYHEIYLAGDDELRPDNYYLPQYPEAKFPEGDYEFKLFCTSEFATDTLYDRSYLVRYLDGTNNIDDNYYIHSDNHTFTVDITAPTGLNVSIIYPDKSNPGYTFYDDKITYEIKTSATSSDVDFYLIAIHDTDSLTTQTPKIYGWKNHSASAMTITGLNLTDGGIYYVHALGVDHAGNQQKISDVSQKIIVDTSSKPTCNDSRLNNGESDVDCGGNNCGSCELDSFCNRNSDCQSNYCALDTNISEKICQIYIDTCENNILDGSETDLDCGGTCDNKCELNQSCISSTDCDVLLYCNNDNVCENSCGDGICDGDRGEDDIICPSDCEEEELVVKEKTDEEKCNDRGRLWVGGKCVTPDPEVEESNIVELLLIIFALLVIVCAGAFLLYTKIKPQSQLAPKVSSAPTPRPNVQAPVLKSKPAPSKPVAAKAKSVRKPYQKKRDLSIMGAFDEKEDVDNTPKEIKLDKKQSKPKEKSKDDVKPKKESTLDDLAALDSLSELDSLAGDDDLDALNKLSSKEDDDLNKLAKFSDKSDEFDELSNLVGESHATKVATVNESKKEALFDTLSAMKSTDKSQNKNIFQQVLIYLVKSKKLDKDEISQVLLDLANKDIIDKKDMMDVLYNIEKSTK